MRLVTRALLLTAVVLAVLPAAALANLRLKGFDVGVGGDTIDFHITVCESQASRVTVKPVLEAFTGTKNLLHRTFHFSQRAGCVGYTGRTPNKYDAGIYLFSLKVTDNHRGRRSVEQPLQIS